MTFFLSCSFIAQFCYGQYNWTNYDTSNSGLTHTEISCLISDKTSNVWIGLGNGIAFPYGLIKFDGAVWTSYDSSNSGLPSDVIFALNVDTNNNLWIGTNQGLVKYDGSNWNVYKTSNSGIISNLINCITIDSLNRLWIGSNQWGISIFDGVNWINHTQSDWPIPNNCINSITFDNNNKVWLGFDCGGGIAVLNLSDSTWTYYTTSSSDLPSNYVSSIVQDHTGNIWAGIPFGFSGLAKFDGSNWISFTPFQFSSTWVTYNSMAVDSNNNLWVATKGEGLYKYDGTTWTQYGSPLPNTGLSAQNQSVSIDINNRLWYGEFITGLWTTDLNIGMNESDFKNNNFVLYPNPSSDNLIIELSAFDGDQKYLSIYDMLGKIVFKSEITNNKMEINVSGLRSGVYFVEIQNEKSAIRKKIIKL